MSASSAFVDLLEQLNMWWPEGDGNALRAAADGWSETAELIDEITTVLNAVAHRLTDNYRGEAADRFGETWSRWSNDTGHLRATAQDCRRLAAALNDFASDVDVADRTLVQFIEQALAAAAVKPNPLNPMMLPQEWLTWLQTAGAQLLAHLATQTCTHTNALNTGVGNCALPTAPGDRPDIANILRTNITWPDPGKPADLSGLIVGEINFGAGQGFDPTNLSINDALRLAPWWSRLPGTGTPTVVGGPPPSSGPSGGSVPAASPGLPGPTVTATTDPGTTPAASSPGNQTPSVIPTAPLVTLLSPPVAESQFVVPPTATESTPQVGSPQLPQPRSPLPGIAVATGPNGERQLVSTQTAGGPGAAATGQNAPLTDEAFDKLVDEMLGSDKETNTAATKVDPANTAAASRFMPGVGAGKVGAMSVRPLSLSSVPDAVPKVPGDTDSVTFGTPTAVAIPAAGAAAAVATKAGKRAGSNFPMMPLGGGAMSGGDDSNEPKRRNRKRIVTPPPIVQ